MRPGRPRSRAWHDAFRLVPDPRSRGAETAFIDPAARPQGPTHALRQGPRGARIPHDAVRRGSPRALADTRRPPLPPPAAPPARAGRPARPLGSAAARAAERRARPGPGDRPPAQTRRARTSTPPRRSDALVPPPAPAPLRLWADPTTRPRPERRPARAACPTRGPRARGWPDARRSGPAGRGRGGRRSGARTRGLGAHPGLRP